MSSKDISSKLTEDALSQMQGELLSLILQPEDTNYPLNPADLGSEAFFTALEQQFELEEWSDEEISVRSQALFTSLDSCWEQASSSTTDTLTASLLDKFGARIPQHWLEAIAQKASAVISSNLSVAEKLVQCVQQQLPNWAEEDLIVFSRPLAYAMRGETNPVESTLNAIPEIEWSELSDMEQVRLSLAIARYALDSINN
ncbi:MAG TPA: hypothetical protein V6D15_19750 [Oculatellaceae cyanobacterium]|jgi:hypothetical protein